MKTKKLRLWVLPIAGVILLVIVVLLFLKRSEQRLQDNVEKEYLDLFSLFDQEFPGRGLQDYIGSDVDDYAKSYAFFLSAEVNRARGTLPFKLSDAGKNAGKWLLANRDLNGNGLVGWELPVAWDAYGDGTTNPPGTEYTITTALVINALLDWYENDPLAPSEEILDTVHQALIPFMDESHQTLTGFIPFSFSHFDDGYDTYNSAIFLIGQIQRFAWLITDPTQKRLFGEFCDKEMARIILDHRELSDGSWYWLYGDGTDRVNEMGHSSYIVDGIRNYIKYEGALSTKINRDSTLKYLDHFQELQGQFVFGLQQGKENIYLEAPRIYDLGSYLYINALCNPKPAFLANLVRHTNTYQLPDGHYVKYPRNSSSDEVVINEYEAVLLYGYSIILSDQTGDCFANKSTNFELVN